MNIAAMLRVRNEGRWLAEVLQSILPLTDKILVLDDHSTDNTRAVAERNGAAVLPSPFDGPGDEARDKNYLLEHLRGIFDPEYVLCIDGDEVLEAGGAEKILARLRPELSVYSFPIRYLWNDRDHYRFDGVYGGYTRASMFSLVGVTREPRYAATANGCNFHCGQIPRGLSPHGSGALIQADLLHLGYMHAEDRVRKFHWYNRLDPDNKGEDCYRHMVLGDLPEFPATMKRMHGGPLKVFSLPAGKWPVRAIAHG